VGWGLHSRGGGVSNAQLPKALGVATLGSVQPLPEPIYTRRKLDDVATVAWLAQAWRETFNEVERWQRAVNEGGQLEPALRFARYVLWSGLIPLFRAYAQEDPKIDGALLEWKTEELQRSVQERFDRAGKGRIELEETQVERINHTSSTCWLRTWAD
jgi:hypothetical protein